MLQEFFAFTEFGKKLRYLQMKDPSHGATRCSACCRKQRPLQPADFGPNANIRPHKTFA